jgi:hypothetical protein
MFVTLAFIVYILATIDEDIIESEGLTFAKASGSQHNAYNSLLSYSKPLSFL